jgi:hypothetical protein
MSLVARLVIGTANAKELSSLLKPVMRCSSNSPGVVMTDKFTVLNIHSRKSSHLFEMAEGEVPEDDRPHLTTVARVVHWRFKEHIHDWFVDLGIAYELGGHSVGDYDFMYQVTFDRQDHAALFKLQFV